MPPNKIQKSCSFYLAGACKKGKNCPFSHAQQPPSQVICKHFIHGTCMFGERCQNIHEKPQVGTGPGGCKLPSVFWKNGRCSKGDQCKFLHEPLALPTNSNSWRERQPSRSSPSIFDRKLGSRPVDIVATTKNEETSNQSDGSRDCDEHSRPSGTLDRMPSNVNASILPDWKPISGKRHSEGITFSEPMVERSFLARTRAIFESGGAMRAVETGFESCRVTLSNIAIETNHEDIISLAEVFGPLKLVTMAPPALGTAGKAGLEYLDSNDAKTAAVALDGKTLHNRCLTAQLNLRSAQLDAADLRSSTLKMSWFAPSRLAYAHYDFISNAKGKASNFDGRNFAGRKVSAVFQQPTPRQKNSFTVIVKGLPVHTHMGDLKKFCSTQSVDLGPATYCGREGISHVRKLLETFGPLESFDVSHPIPKDIKVKALVRFAKAEHAAAAAAKLQGQSQAFLGGAKTWVTLLHSIKYNISKVQFGVIKDDLRLLQAKGAQDAGAKIRVYDRDETGRAVDPVCVRIYGDDPRTLGQLKRDVEGLLSGKEVIHEGIALWDVFFLTEGSRLFVEGVQKESGAFVAIDSRRRKIRASGSQQQIDHAQELLLQKIQELRDQLCHIRLEKPDLGRLLQGEFARLQDILGRDKLSLDIRNRILIVRGDEEDVQVARLSLRAAEANAVLAAGDVDCPVCFCEVNNPVKLSCGHSFCLSCLRHYLTSAESFPVKCIGDDGSCNLSIPLAIISDILPQEDEAKFFETAFLAHIHRHPNDFHYCPTPDCQVIYRPAEAGTVLRCFSCLARICPNCHVEFHEGLTCAGHRDNQTGEDSFRRWKEANNVQACPECQAPIEKSDGCNHITCVRCGTHMCWVCRATFPNGTGIYDHMQKAHGGIYERGGVYDSDG